MNIQNLAEFVFSWKLLTKLLFQVLNFYGMNIHAFIYKAAEDSHFRAPYSCLFI